MLAVHTTLQKDQIFQLNLYLLGFLLGLASPLMFQQVSAQDYLNKNLKKIRKTCKGWHSIIKIGIINKKNKHL